MKLFTFTAFIATVATTIMASPLSEERGDTHVQNEVSRRDDPPQCQQVSSPTGNVQVFDTQRHTYQSGDTDVGLDSLFSYQHPAIGSPYGTLTIANGHMVNKVVELWSGSSRISYAIQSHKECTARLTFTTIDHYRVWDV